MTSESTSSDNPKKCAWYKVSNSWQDGGELPTKPDATTGPPPPTFFKERLYVKLIRSVKGHYLVLRALNKKTFGYNDKILEEVLIKCFQEKGDPVPKKAIRVGQYFLGVRQEDGTPTLRRIKIMELVKETVKGWDIDTDEVLNCQTQNIFALSSKSLEFPRQVFKVELEGTDNELFRTKCYVKEVLKLKEKYKLKLVKSKTVPAVELLSVETSVSLKDEVFQKLTPQYPLFNEPRLVKITNLSISGEFACQTTKCPIIKAIKEILRGFDPSSKKKTNKSGSSMFLSSKEDIDLNSVYLAKYNKAYHRVKVLRLLTNEVRVRYMDYGNVEEIRFKDLVKAEKVNNLLTLFPEQFLSYHFAGIQFVKDVNFIWNVIAESKAKNTILKITGPPLKPSTRPQTLVYLVDKNDYIESCINVLLLETSEAVPSFVPEPVFSPPPLWSDGFEEAISVAHEKLKKLRAQKQSKMVMKNGNSITEEHENISPVAKAEAQDFNMKTHACKSVPQPDSSLQKTSKEDLLNWTQIKSETTAFKNKDSVWKNNIESAARPLAPIGACMKQPWVYIRPPCHPEFSQRPDGIVAFRVIECFAENDISLQYYENSDFFTEMERNLKDYCEIISEHNFLTRIQLVENNWYALFNTKMRKWVRTVLLDVCFEDDQRSKLSTWKGTFRLVDYGIWVTVPLGDEPLKDLLQNIPSQFFTYPTYGVSASQSQNPFKENLSLETLKQMKNWVILLWIRDCCEQDVIPHLNVIFINVLQAASGKRPTISRRLSL